MKSFYWHDYETWGATPSVDRASQFAGVRTDEALNIISDPLVLYCQPPEDLWPHPEACLVTGILPQEAQAKGVSEPEFIARIHDELAYPGTCGVGYNSLRFDDEVTRYTLYRNFYDPYEREWRNGNSRWDIIDMVRLVYALRPEGIEWPVVDGKPSFKLELLTAANGISHQSAHDAYSDVEATIHLAKLIKDRKPALYQYVVENRAKRAVASMIDIESCRPLLHISSKFSSVHGCAGLIAPVAMHPTNKNAVIAFDLSADPSPMDRLSAEDIRERVFTSQEDLPEGVERLPLKLIHLNKCPVLATTKLLDDKAARRLGIDKARCEAHWDMLRKMSVGAKLQQMYRLESFAPWDDPERQLYQGFFADEDKRAMVEFRNMHAENFAHSHIVFNDPRLSEMQFRYIARNFPQALNTDQRAQWQEFVAARLLHGGQDTLSFAQLNQRIQALSSEYSEVPEKLAILRGLSEYAQAHMQKYCGVAEISAL